MFLRKLGRYLCILGTIKWMNDVLWLDIRCLQAAEAEEWWKKPCSCTTVGRKMTLQSRSGSGQYLVVGLAVSSARTVFVVLLELHLGVATSMTVSHRGHEAQVPIIWPSKDPGLHFLSLEAVTQDPGCLSAAVITTCQLRFSLPLKSHPLFFTSFAEPLCPLVLLLVIMALMLCLFMWRSFICNVSPCWYKKHLSWLSLYKSLLLLLVLHGYTSKSRWFPTGGRRFFYPQTVVFSVRTWVLMGPSCFVPWVCWQDKWI